MTIPPWRFWFAATYGFIPGNAQREHFMRHLRIEGDCWLWTSPDGYLIGDTGYDPMEMAHVMFLGPVPEQFHVTTTCGNFCCMSGHLQLVAIGAPETNAIGFHRTATPFPQG